MIEKSILLHCPIADAFRLFTARVSEWWPPTHRLTKDPQSELFMESTGRFWELARDGREADLGHVVSWDPPQRLALDFYMGSNPRQPTAVVVTFASEGDGTRVTVVHQAKPESQDLWNLRAPVFQKSWDAVLAALESQ